MYICLNCIYLYLYVYCQCLMLTVCTKGLRVTQFQLSVCMCCTVGRIDKADFDFVYFKCQLQKKYCTIVCMYFMYVPNVMLTLWLCSDSCHTCADSKQLLINLSCYIINKYWIQSLSTCFLSFRTGFVFLFASD